MLPQGDLSSWCTPAAVTSVASVILYEMGSVCRTHDGDNASREDSVWLLDPQTFRETQSLHFRNFKP